MARTIDLGNNESASIGVFEVSGGYLAMTLSQSKTFKTRSGAEKWLAQVTRPTGNHSNQE